MPIDTIMIFAAGRGVRMRHLTDDLPKPMVPVSGKPMIDHALGLANKAGIARKIVNTHYRGDILAAHLKAREDVVLSAEPDHALETGGGLKHALPLLDRDVVFTLNPDAVWTGSNPLSQLANAWQPNQMGALLMLIPLDNATGHKQNGDFCVDDSGRVSRFKPNAGKAYVYTGAQTICTKYVQQQRDSHFSLNVIWDNLIQQNQLFAVIHSGGWVDVGTPEGLAKAEAMLQADASV